MAVPTAPDRARQLAQLHAEAAEEMAAEGRFEEGLAQFAAAAALLDEAARMLEAGEGPEAAVPLREAHAELQLSAARVARRGGLTEAAESIVSGLLAAGSTSAQSPADNKVRSGFARPHRVLQGRVLLALLAEDAGSPLGAQRWREVLAAAADADGVEAEILAHGRLAGLAIARGAEREAAEHVAALGERVSPDHGEWLLLKGRLERLRGDVEQAGDSLRAALSAFGGARDPASMATTLLQLGHLRSAAGPPERARELFERALDLAEPTQDLDVIAAALTDLAGALAATGDPSAAALRLAEAVDLLTAAPPTPARREALVGALVNLASREAERGHIDAAAHRLAAAREALLALGRPRGASDVGLLLGQLLARDGRLEAAEAIFEAARGDATAAGHAVGLARLEVSRAALAESRGDLAAAARGYQSGRARLLALQRPLDAAIPALADVELARIRRDFSGARRRLSTPPLDALPAGSREADLLALARARLALEEAPDPAAFADLLALARQLTERGQPLEALAAVASCVDRLPQGDAAALEHLSTARAAIPGRLDGLAALECEALLAWHRRDADVLLACRARAAEAGLRLLRVRFGRQAVEAGCTQLRAEVLAEARALGHASELARLEAAAS